MCNGDLYFRATSPMTGSELYKLPGDYASTEAVGNACGIATPHLAASQPVLGKTCTVSGTGPAASPRLLLAGVQASPSYIPGLVAADCAIWENLAFYFLFPLPSGASWQVGFPVPNTPSTVGAQVMMQSVYNPVPLSLSAGLKLTAGN